jgi:hypothetical protein
MVQSLMKMEILSMAKINQGFVLSYQANAHLYERLDVKKKIVIALVKGGAKKLQSFTDSTIYFELATEEGAQPGDCEKILSDKFKLEKISFNYTIATLWFFKDTKKFTFDSVKGDQDLNKRFLEIVKTVRTELGIKE